MLQVQGQMGAQQQQQQQANTNWRMEPAVQAMESEIREFRGKQSQWMEAEVKSRQLETELTLIKVSHILSQHCHLNLSLTTVASSRREK